MIIENLALICLLKTINKQIFLFGMKGTMNPCVTWTLHAGWYCVLSQWRPRPIWWKVYSPDEAVPSWLTPPPPTPVAMGLRASGYLCPPISPRCGSGTDPRHFLPVSACPYCVPCPFWLIGTHTCVLLPIDLFFQEKHYKAIFLIENIISAVPSTGVCPLRSAYTSRHCLCVQRS